MIPSGRRSRHSTFNRFRDYTNRYKEVEYDAVEYDPPMVIMERLAVLEAEIAEGRLELEELMS